MHISTASFNRHALITSLLQLQEAERKYANLKKIHERGMAIGGGGSGVTPMPMGQAQVMMMGPTVRKENTTTVHVGQ